MKAFVLVMAGWLALYALSLLVLLAYERYPRTATSVRWIDGVRLAITLALLAWAGWLLWGGAR